MLIFLPFFHHHPPVWPGPFSFPILLMTALQVIWWDECSSWPPWCPTPSVILYLSLICSLYIDSVVLFLFLWLFAWLLLYPARGLCYILLEHFVSFQTLMMDRQPDLSLQPFWRPWSTLSFWGYASSWMLYDIWIDRTEIPYNHFLQTPSHDPDKP